MTESSDIFQQRYKLRFIRALGEGKDGRVFETENRRAVKFIIDTSLYRRELRAYQVLRQRDIHEINGLQVPELIRSDDSLLTIELTVVQPPFLLDFASAYTRQEYAHLAFSDEVMAERNEHWAEIFGERWAAVYTLREAFTRATELILLDLNPNNIKFS